MLRAFKDSDCRFGARVRKTAGARSWWIPELLALKGLKLALFFLLFSSLFFFFFFLLFFFVLIFFSSLFFFFFLFFSFFFFSFFNPFTVPSKKQSRDRPKLTRIAAFDKTLLHLNIIHEKGWIKLAKIAAFDSSSLRESLQLTTIADSDNLVLCSNSRERRNWPPLLLLITLLHVAYSRERLKAD